MSPKGGHIFRNAKVFFLNFSFCSVSSLFCTGSAGKQKECGKVDFSPRIYCGENSTFPHYFQDFSFSEGMKRRLKDSMKERVRFISYYCYHQKNICYSTIIHHKSWVWPCPKKFSFVYLDRYFLSIACCYVYMYKVMGMRKQTL